MVVDPGDAQPVLEYCRQNHLTLSAILITHHHWDHTDGNKALKDKGHCTVVGAAHDAERIPAIDIHTTETTPPVLEGLDVRVLEVSGHTIGHIAYVIDDALFCGDTLFGGGCGRLFEGTPEQMWQSLQKLAALADDTKVYCAHEYTLPNLRFARDVDTDNLELNERIHRDTQARMQQQPTIPSSIGLEKATNPFLRPMNTAFVDVYAHKHHIESHPLDVFTHLRASKDRW